jgi:hypothetical protein
VVGDEMQEEESLYSGQSALLGEDIYYSIFGFQEDVAVVTMMMVVEVVAVVVVKLEVPSSQLP